MIVLRRPNGLRLFFAMRGSILPRIAVSLAACVALAVAVTLGHGVVFGWKVTLTPVPFTLMGLALAIFLGFRNNAAYDRYWEARKLWGELLHRTRSLARQLQTLTRAPAPARLGPDGSAPADIRSAMIVRTIAYVHALRLQLRGSAESIPYTTEAEAAACRTAPSAPEHLLRLTSGDLGTLLRDGRIEPQVAAAVEGTLGALAAACAGCERLASTPLPFAYTLLLHRTASMYCFLLPFGLVDAIGAMTPFVVGVVAYTFFGLDALGDEIEEPFGLKPHHLPLSAMCRGIEIELLHALGVTPLPEPLRPVDDCLQ